ncbi:Nucleoside phosphorylase [Trema orientale]|uniref:Nucleoside phosphorylase n=1 Tax=Trema orientale TaxID=63057 RepID=A0A2P5BSI5_TREOI|nr:Nucleoside phosphorylase [Trema orientale]
MESSAIVMTSLSNGSPVIVIRGISNLAGSTEKSAVFESLAAINTAIAVVEFLKELPADTVRTGVGLHGTWNHPMTS